MTCDEKIRLAQIIGDARELLADQDQGYSPDTGYAGRCGALEVLLRLVCDSAEAFTPYVVHPGGASCPQRGEMQHPDATDSATRSGPRQ